MNGESRLSKSASAILNYGEHMHDAMGLKLGGRQSEARSAVKPSLHIPCVSDRYRMVETTGSGRNRAQSAGRRQLRRMLAELEGFLAKRYGHYLRQRRSIVEVPPPAEIWQDSEDDRFRMAGRPLKCRLAIAEEYVATHPGRAIMAMLLDLFPELRPMQADSDTNAES